MNMKAQCVEAYNRHKNLKLAANEIGVPWQSLYCTLKTLGVPVTGDKAKYGSESDKFAAQSEQDFMRLVPAAKDQNRYKYQSKYDFLINGWRVDLKAARPKSYCKNGTARWSFSLKKQQLHADFFVCLAYSNDLQIQHCLLIPGEIANGYSSLSLSPTGRRWWEYQVDHNGLRDFFESLPTGERT